LVLCLLFPFTSYACQITGNEESNEGTGLPIDQSGYCYPGQSFIAPGYRITDVELLMSTSTWSVDMHSGAFGSTFLGSSSSGYTVGYNVFQRVTFSNPIATIPGNTYTIYPRGSGSWYVNQNNEYAYGCVAVMNPAGLCYGSPSNWDSSFHVNCIPPAPGPWTCFPGIDCPVRVNSAGNIECMAPDGANCLWTSGNCPGTLASPPSTIIPLTCGLGHYNMYGSYGYDQPTHWCYRAWEFVKPWFCLPGIGCPMRLNPAGNPECLSTDGSNCLWNTVNCSTIQVYDASSISPILPLSCGSYHYNLYGITGYESTTHWCYQTVQKFEPVCITSSNTVSSCTGADCTGMRPCPLSGS